MVPTRVREDSVVGLVESTLRQAVARGASDVHFEPSEAAMRVRFRVDGLLVDVDCLPVSLAQNVIARLKVLAGLLTYRLDVPQEGSFAAAAEWTGRSTPLDVRVATFPTIWGERAVVRLLYAGHQVCALDALGLSSEVVGALSRRAELPQGLILVTGPAGSGKSTTLYALARHILATTPERSVISLEDPVEQRVEGMTQIQVSPHGELNYVRAMRSLLRQDTQVLLVGEIRDAETAHLVVEASFTGHLVMSTLHSGDPAEAIARLIEMGIAPYQVVGALSVVCAQRLLRTLCVSCDGEESCSCCAGTSFAGRTACGQVAVVDDALRLAILDRVSLGELRRVIRVSGPDLEEDAKRILAAGRTTPGEIRRVLGSLREESPCHGLSMKG